MSVSLEELLQQCTVKLTTPNLNISGTGFFVAPGLILTCNHVISGNPMQAAAVGMRVQVRWHKEAAFTETEAEVVSSFPNPHDVALLKFNPPKGFKLPCVHLDGEVISRDHLYLFGYPGEGFLSGCPVTVDCEGITGGEAYIKFDRGQIQPGMSGSALLNQNTGMVCGIVKFTRDQYSDLGGGAVQATDILRLFPALKDLQRQFHQNDKRWKSLARKQVTRGIHKLPERLENEQKLLFRTSEEVSIRLANSLNTTSPAQDPAWINLRIRLQPDKVNNVYGAEVIVGSKPSQLLPVGASIVDVFERPEILGKLLILGNQGSGKTTLLLKLTEYLIECAEKDSNYPIPVIFSLASWQPSNSIRDWMISELQMRDVPKKISTELFNSKRILPLLDGLNELSAVKQQVCIRAINQFLEGYKPQYLVVCCQEQAYDNNETKLRLNGAVILQPLSDWQIKNHLIDVGHEELWERLYNDKRLLEFVRTPFLLTVLIFVVADDFQFEDWQRLKDDEEQLEFLLDAYVERMFNRSVKHSWYPEEPMRKVSQLEGIRGWIEEIKSWTTYVCQHMYWRLNEEPRQKDSRRWLTFLAQELNRESKTEFLIEAIQTNWLRRKKYFRLTKLIGALVGGMSFGILYSTFTYLEWLYLPQQFGVRDAEFYRFSIFFLVVSTASVFWSTQRDVKPEILYDIKTSFTLDQEKLSLLHERNRERYIQQGSFLKIVLLNCLINGIVGSLYLLFVCSMFEFECRELGYVSRMFAGGMCGIASSLLILISSSTSEYIKPVVRLQWSWKSFFSRCVYITLSAVIAVPILALISPYLFLLVLKALDLFVEINWGLINWESLKTSVPQIVLLISSYILFPLIAVILPFSGLRFKSNVDVSQIPNQAIRSSGRNFLFIFFFATLFIPLFFPCLIFLALILLNRQNLSIGVNYLLLLAVSLAQFGVILGFPMGLRFGGRAFVQHLSLRSVLWWLKLIPRDYARFLSYATERRFLQQVGGRYWFIHQLVQDHFATMPLRKYNQ
jgi:hypothetical protein